jgi:DNA invertase Pin-like site-specific DNA recombinase
MRPKGKFDVLTCWALDRLSREGAEAAFGIVRRFRERGVRVMSMQEPWTDAGGEALDVLLAIIGWAAQMESKRRSERVKAGWPDAEQRASPSVGKSERRITSHADAAATWHAGNEPERSALMHQAGPKPAYSIRRSDLLACQPPHKVCGVK